MNKFELLQTHPGVFAPPGDRANYLDRIATDVLFSGVPRHIGQVACIGERSTIFSGATLDQGVELGRRVTIGRNSVLGAGVILGDDTEVGNNVIMRPGSGMVRHTQPRRYPNYRTIYHSVVVGDGVILPQDAQVGPGVVVPTRDAVATIGPVGAGARMVTVNGSPEGPRYNVHNRIALSHGEFMEHARVGAADSSWSGAAAYAQYMDEYARMGESVQLAFKRETGIVDELTGMFRETYGRDLTDTSRVA